MLDDIKVYMNTWKNYNEYGADLEQYGIKDGWMSIDDGLAFCDKYADDEPFINDIDNPTVYKIELSDYANPWQVLRGLKALQKVPEEIGYDDTMTSDLYEAWALYNDFDDYPTEESIEEFKQWAEEGDYHYWSNVENDYDLGYAIIDEFGTEGITHPEYYVDEEAVKDALQQDVDGMYDEEDEDWYEVGDYEVEEFIKNATPDQIGNFFDYEKLGRDITMEESVCYTSNGNCVEIYN